MLVKDKGEERLRARKREYACAQEWVGGTLDHDAGPTPVKGETEGRKFIGRASEHIAQLWESPEQANGKPRAKIAPWRSPASGRNGPARALP